MQALQHATTTPYRSLRYEQYGLQQQRTCVCWRGLFIDRNSHVINPFTHNLKKARGALGNTAQPCCVVTVVFCPCHASPMRLQVSGVRASSHQPSPLRPLNLAWTLTEVRSSRPKTVHCTPYSVQFPLKWGVVLFHESRIFRRHSTHSSLLVVFCLPSPCP